MMFYTRWVDSDAKASIERHANIGVSSEIALVYTSQLIGSDLVGYAWWWQYIMQNDDAICSETK